MCLAIPGRLEERFEIRNSPMGKVDFNGLRRDVCLSCVPDAKVGDFVIVHVGFAISIVDVLLPRTNGFEVCFEIKRTAHGKKTPVFLMSAIYKDLDHAEGYAKNDLKAQAYFVKPFDLERLLSHVQLFIGDA